MPTQPIISTPEPLYIADAKDRLMTMLVDAMFDRLISEVEEEEESQTLKK